MCHTCERFIVCPVSLDSVLCIVTGLWAGRISPTIPGRGKCKGKVPPITGHEGPEGEQMYSYTLSSTSALDMGGWVGQRYAPAALPAGKTRYPFYRRLGGPQGRSGRVRKISPTPEFDPRTVQSIASCYTD